MRNEQALGVGDILRGITIIGLSRMIEFCVGVGGQEDHFYARFERQPRSLGEKIIGKHLYLSE